MPNPFFFGGKITNPDAFIGRTTELQRIFSALESSNSGQVQHISVVGERRIGKSSLLYHVTKVYRSHLSQPDQYRFVYIDLLDVHCHTLPGLLHHILESLDLQHPENPSLAYFQESLERFNSKGHHAVLCLDEFEALIRHKDEFPDRVLEAWRSLGENSQAAFLVASQSSLFDLTTQGDLTSPFWNIFSVLELGMWDETDALSLLERSDRPFSSGEMTRLLKLAGTHPAHLQYAARQLYEAKARSQVDWRAIESDYRRQFPVQPKVKAENPWWKRALRWLGKAILWIVHLPMYFGGWILDVFGRTEHRDSSAWITGLLSLAVLVAVFLRVLTLDQVRDGFISTWRFFFPLP